MRSESRRVEAWSVRLAPPLAILLKDLCSTYVPENLRPMLRDCYDNVPACESAHHLAGKQRNGWKRTVIRARSAGESSFLESRWISHSLKRRTVFELIWIECSSCKYVAMCWQLLPFRNCSIIVSLKRERSWNGRPRGAKVIGLLSGVLHIQFSKMPWYWCILMQYYCCSKD